MGLKACQYFRVKSPNKLLPLSYTMGWMKVVVPGILGKFTRARLLAQVDLGSHSGFKFVVPELTKPVLPQAAQLGIFVNLNNTFHKDAYL